MKANKHLLLWSSLGTLLLLSFAIYRENYAQEWRAQQRRHQRLLSAAGGPPGEIKLRQVVVPALGVQDRCVSCHVGMAAGEEGIPGDRVLGPHPKVPHDPTKFGCTVCHGGQGRATTRADAHGEAPHWPSPMIPARYQWAGCGTCHTHISVPSREVMAEGARLLARYDCLACHRVDGRGGTLRPLDRGGMEGPDLSQIGAAGFSAEWYEDHLARARGPSDAPKADIWRAAFGAVGPEDRRTIESYLHSRVGAPALVEAKALFHSLGCRGCHKVHGEGGDDGPDLSSFGRRDPAFISYRGVVGPHTFENWIAEHFRAPARVVPGSQMPDFGLSEREVQLLTLYLFSLRVTATPEAFWPRDRAAALRLRKREFATDGRSLFGAFCAACHGEAGQGRRFPGMDPFPAVGNAEFLAVASDAFLTATIRHGRPGRRMPAWGEKAGGLRAAEIQAIVGYLREIAGGAAPAPDPRPRRWVRGDAAQGARDYARSCAACHGARGQGGQGPALANAAFLRAATDTFLVETIRRGRAGTVMHGFGAGSTQNRALSDVEIGGLVTYLRSWEKRQP